MGQSVTSMDLFGVDLLQFKTYAIEIVAAVVAVVSFATDMAARLATKRTRPGLLSLKAKTPVLANVFQITS